MIGWATRGSARLIMCVACPSSGFGNPSYYYWRFLTSHTAPPQSPSSKFPPPPSAAQSSAASPQHSPHPGSNTQAPQISVSNPHAPEAVTPRMIEGRCFIVTAWCTFGVDPKIRFNGWSCIRTLPCQQRMAWLISSCLVILIGYLVVGLNLIRDLSSDSGFIVTNKSLILL